MRWDLCQATLASARASPGLLELAPGGVLTGLARRTLPGVETVAVKTPADLDAARDLVAPPRRHAADAPRDPGAPVVTRPTLTQATGPAHTRILGLGGVARRERRHRTTTSSGPIDSSDEWIRQRTGIVTRRRAGRGHRRARPRRGRRARRARERRADAARTSTPSSLSTVTYFHQTPAGAAIIADRIGATPGRRVGHLGRVRRATATASARPTRSSASGTARNVLVIGAEKMSDFIDPTDRTHLVPARRRRRRRRRRPVRHPGHRPDGLGLGRLAGAGASARRTRGSTARDADAGWPTLRQEGPTVFKWAGFQMAPGRREGDGRRRRRPPSDIDAFIPHQANMRIIDQMIKQLEAARVASSSAATSPTPATRRRPRSRSPPSGCCARAQVRSGDLALQIGFGAGLVYAAQVVVLP